MVLAYTRALRFTYGGHPRPALDGIDLEVEPGAVVLLEGPSGGGKSTLLRALCGLVPHFHGGHMGGRVVIDGRDTRTHPPARLADRVGLVFQDPEAQAVMASVARDVAFGLEWGGVDPRRIMPAAVAALRTMGAEHLLGRRIATLSGGERQRVALAGVLVRRPGLLLLDEPTSQLDDAGAAHLVAAVRAVRDGGGAVVVGEHRADRARPLADRILAVRGGRLEAAAAPPSAPTPHGPPAVGGPVRLSFEGLTADHGGEPVLGGARGELRAGTVTALCGPNGAGKTLLLRCLAGLHRVAAGRVWRDGTDITPLPPERRFPGLALVGQEAGRHLLTERVEDEVAYAPRQLGMAAAERRRRVERTLEEFDLAALAARHPLDLSVGQRERVALAAALVVDPAVILLDEPTRGMDPAHSARLVAALRRRAEDGAAVLLSTHDRRLAAAAAHTIWLLGGPAPRRPEVGPR